MNARLLLLALGLLAGCGQGAASKSALKGDPERGRIALTQ